MENLIIQEDIKEIVSELKDEIYRFEGKNVLITGANGMLVSYLIYTLIYANQHIFKKTCHLYLITRTKTFKFGKEKFLHYINCDIAQAKPKVSLPMHFVIHAASKSAPKLYSQRLLDTLNTNIKGTYHALDLVGTKTESFLFFSSAEIYGQSEINKSIAEEYLGRIDHLNERSCYVVGKIAGETICINYFWEKNFPIKLIRIFHTFGPGLNLDDGRVFSDFIRDGLNKKTIEIRGDKNIKRSLLYLKDATFMFIKVLLSDKNGEVYNIGNDKNSTTVLQMAKIVRNFVNKKNKKKIAIFISKGQLKFYKHAVKSVQPNINKFIKDFHYRPRTSVQAAFERTIASFN